MSPNATTVGGVDAEPVAEPGQPGRLGHARRGDLHQPGVGRVGRLGQPGHGAADQRGERVRVALAGPDQQLDRRHREQLLRRLDRPDRRPARAVPSHRVRRPRAASRARRRSRPRSCTSGTSSRSRLATSASTDGCERVGAQHRVGRPGRRRPPRWRRPPAAAVRSCSYTVRQPADRPAGDQDDRRAGSVHTRQHVGGARADRLVVAEQRAVEVGGDRASSARQQPVEVDRPPRRRRCSTVISSAAARTSGCALATATRPQPAHANIGRSLGMSPKTSTSAGSTPSAWATTASPVALSTPGGQDLDEAETGLGDGGDRRRRRSARRPPAGRRRRASGCGRTP